MHDIVFRLLIERVWHEVWPGSLKNVHAYFKKKDGNVIYECYTNYKNVTSIKRQQKFCQSILLRELFYFPNCELELSFSPTMFLPSPFPVYKLLACTLVMFMILAPILHYILKARSIRCNGITPKLGLNC